MDNKIENDEKKKVNDKIKERVFELEKNNFKQKTLNSTQMIQKIKKIVEEEVS